MKVVGKRATGWRRLKRYIYPDKIGGDGYQYGEDEWHSGDAAYQDDAPKDRHHRTLCANGEGGHSEEASRQHLLISDQESALETLCTAIENAVTPKKRRRVESVWTKHLYLRGSSFCSRCLVR